ncbi:hypothetical protein [Deinococcus soli (ex Cha et al. 2016)]|uniref:Uncharacterized protein n=2 Tax=Deinococcus soli (ex Cha et al. 2016) TaxID=1309411 RepID=A0AAE4BPY8_9DEIO|nr:hypothetical protein [Deinococcus soli (ex Cha et al. 2016)]MDR6221555.1 hypothetical protein [Deinococcus soli (ex Cha et al. 2016)]MDR6331536.1 hypothetical protein [Deinococcus soli (ex Cha et al. 2016)]MDR6754706.1 hypothetical protein [Deinococcus soli (ex Cha et al. 2016)]
MTMTDDALVDVLLMARQENRLGWFTATMDAWSDKTRAGVLAAVFGRLSTAEPELQIMLYQVGRTVVAERPAPFANRVLAAGGPDALLTEVCWSIDGWADAASVPLLMALVRSDRGIGVKRHALLTLLQTRDAGVPSMLAEVAAWKLDSPEGKELVTFVRELQRNT